MNEMNDKYTVEVLKESDLALLVVVARKVINGV